MLLVIVTSGDDEDDADKQMEHISHYKCKYKYKCK